MCRGFSPCSSSEELTVLLIETTFARRPMHTEALVKRKKRCCSLFLTQEVRQNISDRTLLPELQPSETFGNRRQRSEIAAIFEGFVTEYLRTRETRTHRKRPPRPKKPTNGARRRAPLGKSCFQPSGKAGNIAPFSRTAARHWQSLVPNAPVSAILLRRAATLCTEASSAERSWLSSPTVPARAGL